MNCIKTVLDAKGIKVKWLAEQLNKSYPSVIAYTNNKRQPSIEDLYKIANILNVGVKDLLVEDKDIKK